MNTKIVKIAGITMALFLGLMMVMPVMNVIAADHNTEIHADPDRYTIMAADNWEIHGEDGQHFVMAEHSTEIHYILTKCEAVENQFMLQKFDGDACVGVAYMNGWDASTVIDNWGAGMTIRAWDAGTIIDGGIPKSSRRYRNRSFSKDSAIGIRVTKISSSINSGFAPLT